jgi:signal recognition particle receptor subunit beta
MAFNDYDVLSGPTEVNHLPATTTTPLKIVVVGPFGVGKTTLVATVSDIRPLTTEETMTKASEGIDNLAGIENKRTTTVAMDFGRIQVNDQMVLYLFGAPGQRRFWPLWQRLFHGALGAVVLLDTRRLEDSFDVLEYLEDQDLPFIVAVNLFTDAPQHSASTLRSALDLEESVPVVDCDARMRDDCKNTLLTLTRYLYSRTANLER